MHKKLIILVALLSGISVVAMERIKETLNEASHNEEEAMVKICLSDSQYPETTHEVAIPVRLAKLIGALNKDLVEEPALKDSAFPLPNVTLVQWGLIEPLLEHVYRITHDKSQDIRQETIIEYGKLDIIIEFGKLDVKSLIGVICASDYLEIPMLLECACEVLKKSALVKISWEELEVLPRDIGNQIIMNKLVILLGPVPARELAVCRGHESGVNSVCVREDGKIVSGSYDRTVRVWDMEGNQLAVCRDNEGMVYSVCVMRDGKIVSGSHDATIRIWDMEGNQLAECRGHEKGVYSVCVMEGGRIVSGSGDGTVRVWDMQANQLAECRGHEKGVYSVCVTKDGKIISGSYDNTVRVWDLQGNQLAVCRGHEGGVRSVCITKNGKIVSGSYDKTVRIWDMEGNQLAICRRDEREVSSLCITKDGKIVSACSGYTTVRLWDMEGNELAVCRGHQDIVNAVCLTNDGKIVSGSSDKTVRVWDIRLVDRIVFMDEDQARALWAYVRNLPYDCDKRKCWQEIEKILGEDDPVADPINNNNE